MRGMSLCVCGQGLVITDSPSSSSLQVDKDHQSQMHLNFPK
jgi:hypothetical protein